MSPGPEERDPADCRVLAVLRDVTEFVAIERARAEMVATVSHELRTPLTSISAAVGLLRAGAGGVLPPEAGELVGIAEANALRLRQLVDDILDLEKIEGARVELQAVPVEVAELVRSGLEVVGAMARVRQVRVEAGAVEGTPPIRGDARRLVQVLANLLSNAVKHSPPGGAVRVEAAAGPERVRIAVTDEGPGIPPAEQQRVFERFHQLTGKEGTGLGLAIARALVRQHGGEIGVESPPGSGARFWFEIPRADAGPAQPRS